MAVGLNSRPKEWSRPPEPHPPDAGCWCSRNKRRPYVSLIWCSVPSGHASGLRPRIRNNDRRTAHEPLNLTLDFKHAHVTSHRTNVISSAAHDPAGHEQPVQVPRSESSRRPVAGGLEPKRSSGGQVSRHRGRLPLPAASSCLPRRRQRLGPRRSCGRERRRARLGRRTNTSC